MGKPHRASALAELARFIAGLAMGHGHPPQPCTVPHSPPPGPLRDRAP
jgi:hypothetical protein